MSNIQIREFVPDDYEGLMEVWLKTELGNPQRGDNLDTILRSIRMGGKMLVAVNEQNRIVGTSWMTFDGRRIHLHHFGVHPDMQRRGIGMLLAKESLRFVKQKGYQVKLEVHRNNTPAISLYKKLGFKYLGDYDIYIIRDLTAIG